MTGPNDYIPDWTEQDGPYESKPKEPEYFICGLCTDAVVEDENTYCPACQAAEAEYREGK